MKKLYSFLLVCCTITISQAQVINFPDANFKAKLLQSAPGNTIAYGNNTNIAIDANGDGEITQAEASIVTGLKISNANISDLSGINFFTGLITLDCDHNQLSSIDVSSLTNLQTLNCSNNQLLSLNGLSQTNLGSLKCHYNQLTSLNVAGVENLTLLHCYNNRLTNIDVSGLVLGFFNCSNNLLTSLDFTGTYFDFFSCSNNNLNSINLKNGIRNQAVFFDIQNNPNLQHVCVDDIEQEAFQIRVIQQGYTNCSVNSYCSFVPGGTTYRIEGTSKFDSNYNTSCEASDAIFSNLKYSVTDGTTSGVYIGYPSGNYSIPVLAGTHTITPVLENPTYFNVSPVSTSVTFPTQASPFSQDFCVKANGVHPDLETVIVPLMPARPGFSSEYALLYRNKGNQVQSGSIALTFDDSKMDVIDAAPIVNSQALNTLSWNYTNLLPYEKRVIRVKMRINAPTDTPAVNAGDQLGFTVALSPIVADETPQDNTFVFNQIVVNSFDPNDKTCLQGNALALNEVGKYVHYMIRFENTGTYPAENIVVKDMIDTNKFDVNSIVPIKGSHNYFTRIKDDKVEFIFENINLPFDDANNDGYVVFKIKTKPTLVEGDTFSNSASIYFDYNLPIITNTAVTTIQALSNQDFDYGYYFAVYPNPINDVLNIETKQTIKISSINIYNALGQLVLVIPNAQNVNKVDVSSLSAGNYFIKINSNKGTANTKFIKN
ncbi:T9SS type A sorting domain-containing protein [Flavobacterium sp. SM15]|uniref:DUF7619 domain-containing protein n=1 Tax=Flavobacterium sp. SM15 TaxID=2908005 RepID=UPI001EDC32D2|nr:T9SS type A sorting domain-containing protein [Flavobacterium sp. SM15]MCG2611428.1 T9SS type A sorting domain-containing protein [Flavobacterium sp. SM15]